MIGDSHTCSFSGTDNYNRKESILKHFRIYSIIPIRAEMISEPETDNDLCKQFFHHVGWIPRDEIIIPVLGEIDIRTTIAQRYDQQHLDQAIAPTLHKFHIGINKIREINKNVALLSPFPINKTYGDPNLCTGPLNVNHQICLRYDEMLGDLARSLGIVHLTITKQMFDQGLYLDKRNYIDWCHVYGSVVRELLAPQFLEYFGVDICPLK
jgi:hypothetical protein